MDFAVVIALVLCALTVPGFGDTGSGKAQSCSDIRQFYNGNGFSLKGVPQSEISGEHLRICPQGYTCCTSVMEDSLSNLSRTEMQGLIRDAGRALQASLNGQYKAFDDYLLELLNRSEVVLQESYPPVLGFLYTQNTRVFSDLYTELRRYYRGSNINIEEALNEFWARLLERLFKGANGQYLIGTAIFCIPPYLVTTPLIVSKLLTGTVCVICFVVCFLSQVPLSPECVRAIMKMTYCRHCRGVPSARPCANYCANVLKGCLANHADLDTEWRNLADAMLQVANRFEGASSVNVVFLSLPKRISEAITTMMDNIDTFNTKVFQACGNLREGGTSNIGLEEVKKRGKVTVQDSPTSGARLEKLVSDVSRRLRDMQSYWVSLPSTLCSDRVATRAQGDDKCWNGMARARYLPEVMGDGLASQINNPEVEIDITKPDMTIRQQIMQLKIMTNRLRNAFNGNDVDFQDTSDDVSGSGSGMCADDNCARGPRLMAPNTDRPKLYAYPPENKKVVKASANHNLPFIALYLLSLVTLLLRR
uniref:Glypican-1 n=1 Tax=Oncorhynchus mykiss TaxID=8022 RepID=A0A8C7P281_ONCMY